MSAALLLLVLLAAWELVCRAGGVDPLILPPPSEVAEALWTDRGLLAEDLLVTTSEVVLGLALAMLVGGAVALAMHLSDPVRRALHPLVIGSQAIPVPVIAPLLLFVLGFGIAPKVIVVALVCFFPLAIALFDGLRAPDRDQLKLMRSLGASRAQTLRLLELPSALPRAFTGLKVAAAVSVIGAVFAEWIGSDDGLGHGLLIASGQLETARAFAATVLLFALAIALYAVCAAAERRTTKWTR
jgi:putative hydroxymethylpyrimidine transport system permease protein